MTDPCDGHRNVIHADYVAQFRSTEWEPYAANCNILLHTLGVKNHNPVGVGELYHLYIRQVYCKVKSEHKNMELECALSLAIRKLNVTNGKNDPSPCLTVFGIFSRLTIASQEYPEQRNRMSTMETYRTDMAAAFARQQLATSPRLNFAASADLAVTISFGVLL